MAPIVRFAPSPTGYLHIGGARTALFNWLYAKNQGGTFLLRIEDTDRERSTQEAVDAILDGLSWLGLDSSEEPIFQFARAGRHQEIAHQLVEQGKAFRCYLTPSEMDAAREKAKATGHAFRSNWRDAGKDKWPENEPYVVRIKAPDTAITVKDHVRGEVTVQAKELDDMVLLRSDGTPTYMLAVVVDDHDMHITHVIRGDDHFTNTFRQVMIYQAMGWPVPEFAHVPLIHGPDGSKLSKRHGALGVDAYRDMGYLPEAIRNYLLRLGWSHGDDEIISTEQAIDWFNLEGLGASPSRFDFDKLANLNGHYIREADDQRLCGLVEPRLEKILMLPLTSEQKILLRNAMPALKARAKTLEELAAASLFFFRVPTLSDADKNSLDKVALEAIYTHLQLLEDWSHSNLELACKTTAEATGIKLGKLMAPIRLAITGSNASPSMFEVMAWLGKDESLARMKNAL
ncbi:MAG: glutamate--tRNA ligase [Rickettsiales bacterium]